MKVPFLTPQNQLSLDPKQANSNANAAQTTYEPKSVLDVRHSPSPTATKPAGVSDILYSDDVVNLPLEEDHGMSRLEDWDSLMRELGLHDDSTHASKLIPQFSHSEPDYNLLPEFQPAHSFGLSTQFVPPDFTHFDHSEINNWDNVGFDFVDELIRLAECLETNSLQLGDAILARLNQKLRSPVGKPLQRAAYYFKEALQSLLTGSNQLTGPSTPEEVIQTIKAYRTFSNVSPIPMFSNFTANQAILEAVDGSRLVHVIDFDIGLGGHWASFMKEIAEKAESRKSSAPVLRLTAVVPEEYEAELRLIRDNLCQFARELEIVFEIDFVSIRTFEFLSFKAIKFIDGEKTAVILSPTVFRRVGAGFVNDLRRIAPHVVVHVDGEGLMGSGTASLRQVVIDGLEFYSTILESLEAANVGGGGDWIRRIEMFVLLPRMFAAVEAAGRRGMTWREAFAGAGMRPVGLSQFADFQAECLLRRVQVRGFHVAKRQGEMLLCWHERALVATSAWRC